MPPCRDVVHHVFFYTHHVLFYVRMNRRPKALTLSVRIYNMPWAYGYVSKMLTTASVESPTAKHPKHRLQTIPSPPPTTPSPRTTRDQRSKLAWGKVLAAACIATTTAHIPARGRGNASPPTHHRLLYQKPNPKPPLQKQAPGSQPAPNRTTKRNTCPKSRMILESTAGNKKNNRK